MYERILSELTRAQIEYTSIHINNLIDSGVYGRELSRADLLAEQKAARRLVNIYKAKYKLDKGTNEALIRYMKTIPAHMLVNNKKRELGWENI